MRPIETGYHTKFGWSRSNRMGIGGVPKIGDSGVPYMALEARQIHWKHATPRVCHHAKFVRSG